MSSKKILVLAYALSPTRGSEYSVAWNYVTEMSKDNQLVILYGSSGDHMGDISEMEGYFKNKPLKNVRFVSIKPSLLTNSLNILNKKGILPYTFYFAYHFWHKQVYKVAVDLVKKERFDLIHYLNPIGYREPGFLWKIDLPYIWGPIGGANNVSTKLIKALPFQGKMKLILRALINSLQLRYKKSLHKALESTDLLLTATTENQKLFKKIHNKESDYLPENGIKEDIKIQSKKFSNQNIKHFVWIGSIEARKALIILLKALCLIEDKSKFIIDIIGDGPMKIELQSYAEKKGINGCIIWHGNIPRKEVLSLLSNSYLNIITSVSEGNPTTIWEAMSVGVPTITLDHCGMHDTVCSNCGVKIKLNSYNQVVNSFAEEIEKLIQNPDKLKELSDGVKECSKNYMWDDRKDFFNQLYEKAIIKWKIKKNI